MSWQTAGALLASEGDHCAAADGDAHSTDSDEDTEVDDDVDDEFVDAGYDVDDTNDSAPWVNERRHSGDGEVILLM